MRVIVSQGELEDKLNMASKAIAKKSVKPILSGFLFDISDGEFKVFATDMETGVKALVVADEVDGEAKFVVEAAFILDIVKNLPNDTVTLEYNEDGLLEIYAGRSKFSISTMEPSEFPDFVEVEAEGFVEIDTAILEDMIDKVLFSAATDEFMRNLNGVYWEFFENNLRFVASDGFRLALIDQQLENSLDMNFLISLKSMKELQNVISNTGEPSVRLKYDGKRLSVEAGDVIVVMRTVDADFPDYRRVLPTEYNLKITTSTNELMDALKRIMIVAKRGSEAVKIMSGEGELILETRSPDSGEGLESIDAEVEGSEITAAFNPKFLMDALKHIKSPEVELLFVSQSAPLKLKPADTEEYFYIIMPIRMG